MNFSSTEFIAKIINRDEKAITLLITNYHEILIKGALKQKLSFDQADEVVQATWSTFFQNVENFQGRSHIRTYLFGIMYNKIKELWRSNKKYTSDYSNDHIEKLYNERHEFAQSPQDPSHWIESNQFIEQLDNILHELPPNQRMAFILKEVDGESTEDICNILGISSTNLGVLLYRAKNNIRTKLEKIHKKEDVNE